MSLANKLSNRKLSAVELALLKAGARWASNTLVELCGNFAQKVPEPAYTALRNATKALMDLRMRLDEIESEGDE